MSCEFRDEKLRVKRFKKAQRLPLAIQSLKKLAALCVSGRSGYPLPTKVGRWLV